MNKLTKQVIYDNICSLLTAYEEHDDMDFSEEMYEMLCLIKRHWEDAITVQEG